MVRDDTRGYGTGIIVSFRFSTRFIARVSSFRFKYDTCTVHNGGLIGLIGDVGLLFLTKHKKST